MSSIKVAVRCRPLFEQERPATGLDIQGRRILLDSKTYDPDYTFPPTSNQDDVFAACKPILQCVKDGLNGTLMVYGQTGTGKTYTMLGNDGADNGLVHKVIAHMLDHVQQKTMDGAQCALTLSMIEIYNERLTDMLSDNGEQEVTLIGGFPRATCKVTLGRVGDANEAVKKGLAFRHTAATMMNERSSRSHVVFIVDLEEYNAYTEETEVAHLFMVDLAGSESIKKSQASGSTASEAGKINKSLLALKSVFLALSNTNEATRPAHVPYRDSRLTKLLQDSIGGTARTLMIACISSVGRDIEETKSTLMYAVKARSIRNAANTEKEKLLTRLRSIEVENQRLRNRLQERVNERGGYYITKEEHDRYDVVEAESKELRESVEQLIKDSQASDARKHISESQTKILQGLVNDKEEELQAFKSMYQEALQKFERNAAALQRLVHGAVGDVRHVMQGTAAQRHERLVGWKTQLLALLEAPAVETILPPAPASDAVTAAVVSMPPLCAPPPSDSPAHGGGGAEAPLRTSSARGSVASGASRPASPGRKGGRVNGAVAAGVAPRRPQREKDRPDPTAVSLARALEEEGGAGDSAAASPKRGEVDGRGSPALPLAAAAPPSFLLDADSTCLRIVQRVNTAFADLVHELVSAYERCEEASKLVAATHAQQTEAACEQLRRSVEDCVGRLRRAGRTAAEDAERARDEVHGRLRVLHGQYGAAGPCEAEPLQAMVRGACAAAVRSAEECFPPPEVPAEVRGGLDRILVSYQSRLSAMYSGALAPLAAADATQQAQAFGAMLSASQRQQRHSQTVAAVGATAPNTYSGCDVSEPSSLSVAAGSSGGPESPTGPWGSRSGSAVPPLAPALASNPSGAGGLGPQPLVMSHAPPASSPSRAASTLTGSPSASALAMPPRPHNHSRTASYTGGGGATGKENRSTAGAARLSGPTGAVSSTRSSLRAQRPSSANASPRPVHKRTRSATATSGLGGGGGAAPESGRRPPTSRTERK